MVTLCKTCGFDKNRPRGHIFLTKSVVDYAFVNSGEIIEATKP